MRGRGLRWEDHKFKAQHEIRISICTERMGVGQIISSPQHSKDDEIQNPLHRWYLVVLQFHLILC